MSTGPRSSRPINAKGLFDPATHQFKESLTPLMLRTIKAHRYLCADCDPDFRDRVISDAETQAKELYERSVGTDVKMEIYEQAKEKYRSEAKRYIL